MKKLKYIVAVNFDRFEFEDGAEALKFCESAALNFKPGEYRDKIDVSMRLNEAEDPEDNGEASAGAAMLREDY